MIKVVDHHLSVEKESLKRILQQLQQFTHRISHDETARVLSDLRDRIDEPYMFVIVGEVKAGKSSFINALMDSPNLCAVAPSPMTDSIQQILYGETPRVEEINPYLKRIYQPNSILKDIAIVDTPGTNTIITHHQEITERFIPGSDLIVFVFEAKNPYRQSAWDFFDYIHAEWHKKVVFVLQQKDLMEPGDLAINMEGTKEHAQKKGILHPTVFAVSAKLELEGQQEQSGFAPLKSFILDHITGGKAQQRKLSGMAETIKQITGKIQQGLSVRQAQLDADIAFRKEITDTIHDHTKRAKHQADLLVENLMGAFDRVSRKYEDELSHSLSFFPVLRRSIGSIFSKSQSIKAWFDNFTSRLKDDFGTGMQEKINDRVLDLAESIQQMAHNIDLQIRNSKTILASDHDIFSEIAERRQSILRELREAFEQFLSRTENFRAKDLIDSDTRIGTNVAAGSGIAVVGIILAAVTQGMVFDITGGVLSAIGFLLAGVTLGLQRGKVMKKYKSEMEKGRSRLEDELSEELYKYIETLKSRMETQFARFDNLIQQETTELGQLSQELKMITFDLEKTEKAIAKG